MYMCHPQCPLASSCWAQTLRKARSYSQHSSFYVRVTELGVVTLPGWTLSWHSRETSYWQETQETVFVLHQIVFNRTWIFSYNQDSGRETPTPPGHIASLTTSLLQSELPHGNGASDVDCLCLSHSILSSRRNCRKENA